MIRKIILYKGDMETTSFFLTQMADGFRVCGLEVLEYQFDVKKAERGEKQDISEILDFYELGNTIVLSFNFAGIFGGDKLTLGNVYYENATDIKDIIIQQLKTSVTVDDEQDGGHKLDQVLLFDVLKLPYINIMVDHPYHYHLHLQNRTKEYAQINIDRNHIRYMEHYFPEITLLPYLPSGGTELAFTNRTDSLNKDINDIEAKNDNAFDDGINGRNANLIHMDAMSDMDEENKKYDVVFTGTYIDPECFRVFMNRHGREYADFYQSIVTELLQNPDKLLENVARRRLIEEIPEVTEEELKETLGHMKFMDYYIRFYVRGEVIKTLVNHGIQVHVFGGGWETFVCDHPENLFYENENGQIICRASVKEDREDEPECKSRYLNSKECLLKIRDAKISLNILPWFKDGAHDRIYNSMLNHTVCVTDDNVYLRETLSNQDNICFYKIEELEKLPDLIKTLLRDEVTRKRIAGNAYEIAKKEQTWYERAKQLVGYFEKLW